jgi:hypothetical protein
MKKRSVCKEGKGAKERRRQPKEKGANKGGGARTFIYRVGVPGPPKSV